MSNLQVINQHLDKAIAEMRQAQALINMPGVPWHRDLTGELATHPGPWGHWKINRDGGWWQRTLEQITHLTFHHTLSDSPHAFAEYYVQKDGGRPTIPYTIWITQTGEILLCVTLTDGNWHDHTGHENVHLSVGLAGTLHKYHPAEVQLDAAAEVANWAIRSPMLPGIAVRDITGHMDWIGTQCPGWDSTVSGNWKSELYERIG